MADALTLETTKFFLPFFPTYFISIKFFKMSSPWPHQYGVISDDFLYPYIWYPKAEMLKDTMERFQVLYSKS